MIDCIIDTNVLLSGLFWSGTPAKILDAWHEKKIKFILSEAILEEYLRVGEALAKKYKPIDISNFVNLIAMHSSIYEPVHLDKPITADPDDEIFFACAISANCKIIVSGDKHLLASDGHLGIGVYKPAKFVNQYLGALD